MGDQAAQPVLHVSQIAALLGLPEPAHREPARLGRDATAILEAWLSHLGEADFALLTRPTPSRGRSLRNLTVNVFHPFELIPGAWETGRFDWRPEEDERREHELRDVETVLRFAQRAAGGFHDFLTEQGDELGRADRLVGTPRGAVSFSSLLDFQRWHAAYHYRQLVEFLRVEGASPQAVFLLDRLVGLSLPADVY